MRRLLLRYLVITYSFLEVQDLLISNTRQIVGRYPVQTLKLLTLCVEFLQLEIVIVLLFEFVLVAAHLLAVEGELVHVFGIDGVHRLPLFLIVQVLGLFWRQVLPS